MGAVKSPHGGLSSTGQPPTVTLHYALHIHPIVDFQVDQYDFTPELIQQVMNDSCRETKELASVPELS